MRQDSMFTTGIILKKIKNLVLRVVLKSEIGHISFFMVISLINSRLFVYIYIKAYW
jgi:hypothetical protein